MANECAMRIKHLWTIYQTNIAVQHNNNLCVTWEILSGDFRCILFFFSVLMTVFKNVWLNGPGSEKSIIFFKHTFLFLFK